MLASSARTASFIPQRKHTDPPPTLSKVGKKRSRIRQSRAFSNFVPPCKHTDSPPTLPIISKHASHIHQYGAQFVSQRQHPDPPPYLVNNQSGQLLEDVAQLLNGLRNLHDLAVALLNLRRIVLKQGQLLCRELLRGKEKQDTGGATAAA